MAMKFATVLDIGCGRGQFAQMLASHNKTVYAIDISEVLINQLRVPGVTFKCAAQHQLPFMFQFDLVTSIGVLEHAPESVIIPSIKELSRVAKNDVVVLVGWNKDESFNMKLHMTIKDKSWWLGRFRQEFAIIETIKDVENGTFLHLKKTANVEQRYI